MSKNTLFPCYNATTQLATSFTAQISVILTVHCRPEYKAQQLMPITCLGTDMRYNLEVINHQKWNLCFVDHASMYNLGNKTNLVRNLFLIYLSISKCYGRLWAHHQEKPLCFCDTWHLLLCWWLVCRVDHSHPHRITSTKCRKNKVVSPDDGPIVACNM